MFYAADDHMFFSCPFTSNFNCPVQPTELIEMGRWLNIFQGSDTVAVKVSLLLSSVQIWRSIACFDNALPNDPCDIIYST